MSRRPEGVLWPEFAGLKAGATSTERDGPGTPNTSRYRPMRMPCLTCLLPENVMGMVCPDKPCRLEYKKPRSVQVQRIGV